MNIDYLTGDDGVIVPGPAGWNLAEDARIEFDDHRRRVRMTRPSRPGVVHERDYFELLFHATGDGYMYVFSVCQVVSHLVRLRANGADPLIPYRPGRAHT